MTVITRDRLAGARSSLAVKAPCRLATTANITLAGSQTIDGVTVAEGDRILVKNQTTAAENGIYEVRLLETTWARAQDWNGTRDVTQGTRVAVVQGDTGRGVYQLTTSGTIQVGTTSVSFAIADSDAGGYPYPAASRTILKALDTSLYQTAYLTEAGREGVFLFKTGDYSTQVAADTQEGIYIAADDTASTSGAWVRDLQRSGVSPRWFGAAGDASTDDTTAVQAAIDFARSSFNSTSFAFENWLDLHGYTYKITSSLDLTELRQPHFTLGNGRLYGVMSGGTVLDMAGTNSARMTHLDIWGDETSTPDVGLYFGRGLNGAISPNTRMENCVVDGYFTKAAVVNFASEVSTLSQCYFGNREWSDTAVCFAMINSQDTAVDFWGGALASAHTTLVSTGTNYSNVCHNLNQCQILRIQKIFTTDISSISKANPAVVTMGAGAVSSLGLQNGDVIRFSSISGMTELSYQVCTVANISGDTFELSGVNSTGYGTFTSGSFRNKTGPAWLVSGANQVDMRAGYVLTYGDSLIVVDAENGSSIRDWDVSFQPESSPPTIIEFLNSTSTQVVQGLRLNLLNLSQTIQDEVFKNTGGATVRIDNLVLHVANLASSPSNGLFDDPSVWNLKNAKITVPIAAAVNDLSSFAGFSGNVYSVDGDAFEQSGTIPSRFTNRSNAASNAALIMESDRSSPSDNDNVYLSAYLSNDSGEQVEFARIAGAAVDVSDGTEDGRIAFGVISNGSFSNVLLVSSTQLMPNANDGASLGAASLQWSDLYLASGGTIKVNNSDVLDAAGGLTFPSYAATAIADIGNDVNTANKKAGKTVWDSTNNRVMVASGSAAAAAWYVADGSASVTPA